MIELAKELRDYCRNTSCNVCLFRHAGACVLTDVPCNWDLEVVQNETN